VQEAIRDVQPPSSYARDLAVDAALAEFDRIHLAAAPVMRAKPRPSYGRWLAVAAAVAGLAALGAVITATARGGGGDSDAAGAEAAAEQSTLAFDTNATDRAPSAGGAPAAPQTEAAEAQTKLSTEAPASTSVGAAEASQSYAAATTAAPALTAAAPAPSASDTFAQFDPRTPIADDIELGRVGRQLLAEWQSGTRESKVGTPCDNTVAGAVLLSDAVVIVDGATRSVLIAADPGTDKVLALDPDSCVVVMTGR
jgi:hypothetical protein